MANLSVTNWLSLLINRMRREVYQGFDPYPYHITLFTKDVYGEITKKDVGFQPTDSTGPMLPPTADLDGSSTNPLKTNIVCQNMG